MTQPFTDRCPWPARQRTRLLLLLLILLAFARLVWQLEVKELWLDEAFSLQRAESSWSHLITGYLPLTDGVRRVDTTDQHPFAYFVFLGLMVRAAGQSEFALRFPAVFAALLLIPAAWVLARLLVRSGALPRATPVWAVLLVAANPFFLWYGREARMYAQVALLALLSTYLLLRWIAMSGRCRQLFLAGYGLASALLLASHYFALLILPVHAGIVFRSLGSQNRRRALLAAGVLLVIALIPGGYALSLLARDPGAGANWSHISLRMLVPDLLNAFSLGLSVDLAQVWPLDLIYGALALTGAAYGLWRMRSKATSIGWLLPALVVAPPLLLLMINTIRPAYMTARHMSLISGFFVLLVAGGLAWLWGIRRWAAVSAAIILLAGAAYSTLNFFTSPRYANGDVAGIGVYLRDRMQPGDLLLLQPVPWGRLYRYYLPLDAVERGEETGLGTSWRGLPLLGRNTTEAIGELETLGQGFRRIWFVQSDAPDAVDQWLTTYGFRADDRAFASPRTALKVLLLLPESPVRTGVPAGIEHPVDVVFGDQVRLVGYEIGQPLMSGGALPVTLYWQPVAPLTQRYKYILRLVIDEPGGGGPVLAVTETEPYSGFLPTTAWPADATVVEYSGVGFPSQPTTGTLHLTLQVYDADTLEKLPVAQATGAAAQRDAHTAIFSAVVPNR